MNKNISLIGLGEKEEGLGLKRASKNVNVSLSKGLVRDIEVDVAKFLPEENRLDYNILWLTEFESFLNCLQISTHYKWELNFTSAQSSANMLLVQNDYFRTHKYERVKEERGKFFHTDRLNLN